MRSVIRIPLNANVEADLNQRQDNVNNKVAAGTLNVAAEWKNARQTTTLLTVVGNLRSTMGECERCMYCLDSHGTDVEHFWPKTPYPERMFQWPNLLLCCAECGRFKGDQFPLAEGAPLLIDPTVEDPWQYLDFDPGTGNVVARYDTNLNDWSARGQKTVEVLQLDRCEAMAAGYRRTYRRLSALVERRMTGTIADDIALIHELREADDHGLIGWCFYGAGRNISPFLDLRESHTMTWEACARAMVQA